MVDRDIEGRVGVDASPGTFDLGRDIAHPAVPGALEEHVLVEVREPEFTWTFIRRPDRHPDLQTHDRGEVRLAQQQRESVG